MSKETSTRYMTLCIHCSGGAVMPSPTMAWLKRYVLVHQRSAISSNLDSDSRICATASSCERRKCLAVRVPSYPARAAVVEARSALQARRDNLERGAALLQDIRQRRTQAQEASTETTYVAPLSNVRKRAEELEQSIQQHRVRLLRDLEFIYPIQLESARDLLYSIAGLALPNGVASTDERSGALVHKSALDESAAALAYVAQIVVLASAYLHIPLPYPLRPVGSRAVVQDPISVMSGPRTFALYGKGVEPYRYEYGVFLLNKDIEQLMHAYGVPMLDLRNTLPNVKNLLVTLASL